MYNTELQYVLVRYMLNELGDEAANIGLVAVTNDPPNIFAKFLADPTVKSRRDIRIERDIVDRFSVSLNKEIESWRATQAGNTELSDVVFNGLREAGGNMIRATFPRSVLTNDAAHELQLLFDQLIEPAHPRRPRAIARSITHRDPLHSLRQQASAALVREFRKGFGRLTRSQFTRGHEVRGANHKNTFDLAAISCEKKKRREHLFQHLLILPDAEETFTQTAALCWRWADVQAANHADRQLTAVLYEKANQDGKSVGIDEAKRLLRKEDISFTHIRELPTFVQKLQAQGKLF